jgi:ubiquinone/menaquinone biosynthesis C-methylase UbiE
LRKKKSGRQVVTLDISKSFVKIAQDNANKAGVVIDVRHGDAAAMPFPDDSFDFIICMAAFKNFSDPIGALNEFHRVLKRGGQASIFDLRKDANLEDIKTEVYSMHLSALNSLVTRWIFRFGLLKTAYTREAITQLAIRSRFGGSEIETDGIGFELRLKS